MDKPRIEIYGTRSCPWCDRAKNLCRDAGLAFDYHDITDDPALQAEFITRTNGARTVPQIFVGIRRIGGFTDLEAAQRNGDLQRMLGGN